MRGGLVRGLDLHTFPPPSRSVERETEQTDTSKDAEQTRIFFFTPPPLADPIPAKMDLPRLYSAAEQVGSPL